MAIAETDPRKSDADETSTGGSKSSTLENESKNMLSGQGTSQLGPVVRRYFTDIKDLYFHLPGGWNDLTLSIFIDSSKTCLPDFQSAAKTDDLKLWSKIVKKCREKSNCHSQFTVNTVLDLAKSLKAYILSNKSRKTEKAFIDLCDDVAEIIRFFPTESSGTMNQNLRQRSRSDSSDVTSVLDAPGVAAVSTVGNSIDHIVIKCCHDFQNLLESPKTSSKYVWSQLNQKIYDNCGLKLDVKKHISDMKKNVIKETKKIIDPKKRELLFKEMVGDYRPLFDNIPPLNVRVEDFILTTSDATSDIATPLNTTADNLAVSDDKSEIETPKKKGKKSSKTGAVCTELDPTQPTPAEIPVVDTANRAGRKEKSLSTEDSLDEVDPLNGRALRSRQTHQKNKKTPKKQNPQSDDFDSGSPKAIKKRRGRPRRGRASKKAKMKYTPPEESESDSDASSGDNMYTKKHKVPASPDMRSDNDSRKTNLVQPINGWQQHKNGYTSQPFSMEQSNSPNENTIAGGNVSLVKQNMPTHRDQPLAPKTVETKMCISKPVQPNTSCEIPSQPVSNEMSSANQPFPEMNRSNVAPVSTEPSPFHSHGPMPSTSRDYGINQRIHESVDELNRVNASMAQMIEGIKEKFESNTPASMMQLLAVSQGPGIEQDNSLALLNSSRPPSWFDTFVCDYKKHEMWKMHQLLKMQQELVDTEVKKLSVLEKILGSLNDK